MNRHTFLKIAGTLAIASPFTLSLGSASPSKYFNINKIRGRHFLITPEGKHFFSIGINHIDSASLRYPENESIWKEKYDNSMKKWLSKGVSRDLKKWGFNTVGWNQEVVTRAAENHRHSRSFTPEEYRWLNMPYCHMLRFADFHWWENEIINPDFFSKGFEEWCDYVARDEASRLADDPNLIGYFYVDCPTWAFVTEANSWKGPIIDTERLKSDAGRKELYQMASQYYKVTHDAIRRYDKNHLILGDRYWPKKPIPMEVIEAATPYVDVLCFQDFSPIDKIVENLNYWHAITGKPTLVADSSHTEKIDGTSYIKHTLNDYPEVYDQLKEVPSCIGYHLCGAYIANRTRRKGLINENETSYEEDIDMMSEVNREMEEWVRSY